MKKHWLITGGSGFLGINLVRYLLDRGQKVSVIDITDFDYPEKSKINFFKGDIRDTRHVAEAMKNADIVVHTAAALPLYKAKEIFSTEVEGTRNLIKAAKDKGILRFIHISTTAVYGVPKQHPVYEDDPMVGVGAYGEAKIQAERICREYRRTGMTIPILRPKSFIGPERLGVFAILFDWVRCKKNVPIVGKGNNRYQLLDVEDLCSVIWLCATKDPVVVNDTFNIGAEKFTTMKEDFQAVLDEAGHGKKIIGTPAKPLILLLRSLEILGLSPLYKWVYETAPVDSFVSIDKAKTKLGFKPKYSNKQALVRTYNWYLDNYKKYHKKTGVSHRVPWKQGILRVVKAFF
jgi:nucleoside-diphosphate-sugar epimerase